MIVTLPVKFAAPSTSKASKFVVPSTSISPDISKDVAVTLPLKTPLPLPSTVNQVSVNGSAASLSGLPVSLLVSPTANTLSATIAIPCPVVELPADFK